VGSDTEVLNGNRTVMDVNVEEKDSADNIHHPETIVLQSSFPRSGTKVTEISPVSHLYQKMPEVALAEMESGYTDSCKDDTSVELPDSLKQPQVPRDETISSVQATVMRSATAQPTKRKVRTVGTNIDCLLNF